MNNLYKIITGLTFTTSLFFINACVKNDDYAVPPIACTNWEATTTIQGILDKVNSANNSFVEFNEDLIVAGYVISSDQSGNFFKTISIQDAPQNATAGIQIEIDQSNLYTYYPIGTKIFVNLKGLVAGKSSGIIKIGAKSSGTTIDRIENLVRRESIVRSCDEITKISPRTYENIKDALLPENVNTLVTINNVQFYNPELDETYGESGTTVSRVLIDKDGNKLDLRNSNYAKWNAEALPTKSGSITLVLSGYQSSASNSVFSYQGYISDLNDVNFNNNRFDYPNTNDPVNPPSTNAVLAFNGADFNNWQNFVSSFDNTVLSNIVQESIGTGRDGGNALAIQGTLSANTVLFGVKPAADLPANPTRLTFYVKGASAKSLVVTLYKKTSGYYSFNLKDLLHDKSITNSGSTNDYIGGINTNGKWLLVSLDLTNLDINYTDLSKSLLSFRAGSNAKYKLLIDDVTIE